MARRLTTQTKLQLCDALLRIGSMNSREGRQLYITELERHLQQPLEYPRHNEVRHDIYAFVNTCMEHKGALRRFFAIVKQFHPNSRPIIEAERLLAVIEQPYLLADDADALAALVSPVPQKQIRAIWDGIPQCQRQPMPDWSDPQSVVERLQIVSGLTEEPKLLIQFASQLAGVSDKITVDAVYQWIQRVGEHLGLAPDLASLPRLRTGTAGLVPQSASCQESPLTTDPATEERGASGQDKPAQWESQQHHATSRGQPQPARIWGGVPLRNPHFTGREELLSQLHTGLHEHSKASVLPQTLHGYGGVGKTQLAIEYVYRYAEQYQLTWWINAEHQSDVLSALDDLGRRLDIPEVSDLQQRAHAVIDAMNGYGFGWLLVYDNADRPADITPFVPTVGGHVIVTSRNPDWSTNTPWNSIRVDVFDRAESLALLATRTDIVDENIANQMAERLGDLPLALEQAINFQRATAMPPEEYLAALAEQVQDLLTEGQPANYPTTVTALLTMAFSRLRMESAAASELLALFAHLGPEPILNTLLRNGRAAELSGALAAGLRNAVQMGRMIRDIGRFGIAQVDPQGKNIQVHRLVRAILQSTLTEEEHRRSLRNVQNLLGAANPGNPDDLETWRTHAEIGPHIIPADLVGSDGEEVRQVALDQARYLFRKGDYRGSRDLAQLMVDRWSQDPAAGGLGTDHEQTLLAFRHLANALRMTGEYGEARRLDQTAFDLLLSRPEFGDTHEHTVAIALGLGYDLSMAGDLEGALRSDRENLRRALAVHGPEHGYTRRAKDNVATQLRQLGRYAEALELSTQLVDEHTRIYGYGGDRALYFVSERAKDLLGMGRYLEAMDTLAPALDIWRQDGDHATTHHRFNAGRVWAILLRKTGRLDQAANEARSAYRSLVLHLGVDHDNALAARMTYANCLRAKSDLHRARQEAMLAVEGHRRKFDPGHRFCLVAEVNLAIILRKLGEDRTAYMLTRNAYERLEASLGEEHPYTLAAASNYSGCLLWSHETDQASMIMQRTFASSQRVLGPEHPDTLACALNCALDGRNAASDPEASRCLDEVVSTIARVLRPDHPSTLDAKLGRRADVDIEPPTI